MKKAYIDILNALEKQHKKEDTLHKNSTILILDGLNNYIRTWVVQPTVNEDGIHVGGIVGFLQTLGVAIRYLNPTRIIIVFDGKNGSAKRKKILPEYKTNRGHGLRLNRSHKWASDDEEQKQMRLQLQRVILYLKNLPITTITIDSLEADDIIGYLASLANERPEIEKLYISSTDKDFYQLITEKVLLWNPITKVIINSAYVKNKFNGISPQNFSLFRAVDGDASDNIKGISGIGIKTFVKYFPFVTESKRYIPGEVIEYIQGLTEVCRAHATVLHDRNCFELNYKISDLSGSFISTPIKLNILKRFDTSIPNLNKTNIRKMFIEDKLWNSFKDIDGWLNTHFLKIQHFSEI